MPPHRRLRSGGGGIWSVYRQSRRAVGVLTGAASRRREAHRTNPGRPRVGRNPGGGGGGPHPARHTETGAADRDRMGQQTGDLVDRVRRWRRWVPRPSPGPTPAQQRTATERSGERAGDLVDRVRRWRWWFPAPATAGGTAAGSERAHSSGERAGDLVDRVLVDEVVEEGAEDAALQPHGDDLPRAGSLDVSSNEDVKTCPGILSFAVPHGDDLPRAAPRAASAATRAWGPRRCAWHRTLPGAL